MCGPNGREHTYPNHKSTKDNVTTKWGLKHVIGQPAGRPDLGKNGGPWGHQIPAPAALYFYKFV